LLRSIRRSAPSYPLAFLTAICQYVVMVCLYCGSKLSVSNSRPQKRSNSVWRRRNCSNCKAIFTSVESIDPTSTLMYQGFDKHTEPFSRDKLFISVYEACRHRKTASEDARHLSDTVIMQLLGAKHSAILRRHHVVTVTTGALERFDRPAAIQYLAYHPL
jgi:transcriptional regulator NrdR family protein